MRDASPKLLTTFAALVGAVPLVLGWWAYKLWVVVASQAGLPRTLGLFEVLGLGAIAVAALAAPLVRRLPVSPRWAMGTLLALTIANVLLVGLTMVWLTPRYAPRPLLGLVFVLWLAALGRFWWLEAELQRFVGRALVALGWGLVLLLYLPAPWVLAQAMADDPHLPASPLVPSGLARRADAPRTIVLVTFDALRARTTSLEDAKLDATPSLARLARTSTVFTHVHAASDNTLVSLPTVLTGVRPAAYFPHVGNNSIYLRDGFLTGVAAFLAPAGYKSYYATMLINPLTFGLEGEFAGGTMTSGMFRRNQFNTRAYLPLEAAWAWTRDKLAGRWDDEADIRVDELAGAREAVDQGLAYLRGTSGPAFLWVHLGVPHTPYYDVPASMAAEPGDAHRYTRVTEREVASAAVPVLRDYEHVYERYARFGDAQLGRLLDGLAALGRADDALVLVTADHGEDFGLPGHIPHGNGIATEDVSHVPLVVHAPGQRAPRRVDALVGHRDLVPTILGRVYREVPKGLHGRALLDEAIPADRYLYTWAMTSMFIPQLRQAQTIAAYHDHYKYLERFPTREESLYDLTSDPRAEVDLARRLPDVLADMRKHVGAELRP